MIETDGTLGRLLGGLILLQSGCGIASNLWLTAPLALSQLLLALWLLLRGLPTTASPGS